MARHLTLSELENGLDDILQSPKDNGVLKAIVIRPGTDERVSLDESDISPELGVHGDNWAQGCWLSLADGSPHPDVQVAIMNARAIALMSGSQDRWQLAGDNLYIDMDLSRENLAAGQRLRVGTAELEITAQSHNGCRKFADRFGKDAVMFVNSSEGKQLRLRGVYAKIITGGIVRVGDVVERL